MEHQKITDFGNVISKNNIKSVSVKNISEASKYYSSNHNLIPYGCRKSMMGQSLSAECEIKRLDNPSIEIRSDNIVKISSHMKISAADNFLKQWGLQIPISPDHRDLTIGGVLSVGGYDPISLRNGALVDWVKSLTTVSPSGEIREGMDFRPLCGYGKNGMIWDAEIFVNAFRPLYCDSNQKKYTDFLSDLSNIVDDPAIIGVSYTGNIDQGQVQLISDGPIFSNKIIDYRKYRKALTDSWVFKNHQMFRIWSDSFIKFDQANELYNFIIPLVKHLNPEWWSLFSIICKKGKYYHFPHASEESHVLGVGLYINVPFNNGKDLDKIKDIQFRISDKVKILGGKSCLHGWSRDLFNQLHSEGECYKKL